MDNNVLISKPIIEKLESKIITEIKELKEKNIIPTLATVSVADTSIYLKMKQKKAENLGIKTKDYSTDSSTTKELVDLITKLNNDNSIDGILVQRPLPENIDELAVLKLIDEQKDVDGLNYTKQDIYPPAVVTAIMEVLFHYNIELTNKKITIINNSLFLGKPLRKILDKYSTNVVNCNTKTENIKEKMQNADILILAINKPNFIKLSELKDNVVVIDAGYNKENASSLELDQIKLTQRYTPVPKGIGPITIIKLYDQLLEATINNQVKR